jgi:hypothetical protein
VRRAWLAIAAALGLAACGDETPTGVGGGLLPPGAIQTFEVFVDAPRYLVRDTAFGEYSDPRDAGFLMLARQFEGVLNANALGRFLLPQTVIVRDTAGATRTDSTPAYLGGSLQLIMDTAYSTPGPVRLALYRTAQEWDRSATWVHRIDTAGVRLAWAQPGGGGGVLVDTATWLGGADTVRFNVDGATMTQWADTTAGVRGALITVQTAGARLRSAFPSLTASLGSDFRPDTVVEQPAPLTGATFIFDPQPATVASEPRIGGVPAWRTIFQFRERLDTLTVPCPGAQNCRLRLDQVTINHASLQLQPVPSPAGFRPEGDLTYAPFFLLPSERVPLQRSPLGDVISLAVTIPATRFLAPPAPAQVVQVDVTPFMRLTAQRDTLPGGVTPTHLTVTPLEPRMFGFGTFESMPRLRLVLSVARELVLP